MRLSLVCWVTVFSMPLSPLNACISGFAPNACVSAYALRQTLKVCVIRAQLISVEDTDGEVLPLTYDPELIADYWTRRPVSIVGRVLQLLGAPSHGVGQLAWRLACQCSCRCGPGLSGVP